MISCKKWMTTLLLLASSMTGLAQEPSFYQQRDSWQQIIDEVWGPGDPLETKQSIFNMYADRLEALYPLFEGSGLDWDSLRVATYESITDSTSKGAFSAIMAHFAYSFRELHTRMWDLQLENTIPLPGVPIYFLNAFDVRHFGASLTTQDDGSIVVVDVVQPHPLELEPGDIILGFEGIAWEILTEELFYSGIPLGGWYGSTDESIHYMKMTNAGMNWHLFNSIDVVKFSSGDTLNLSLDVMATYYAPELIINTPQLPIAGVPEPNVNPSDTHSGVTYGTVEGTNFGYIYVTKHNYVGVDDDFGDAVSALWDSDGLIIDLRWNSGGYQQLFQGMAQLFDFNFRPLHILMRCNETDLEDLCLSNFPYWFNWNENDPATYYDKPIAVLIGPNAQSFGDIFARTMTFHPEARFFGRPTNGAFAGQLSSNALEIEGWHVTAADFTMSDTTTSTESRARRAVEPDEEIWLTAADIANGYDTVVERALAWMSEPQSIDETTSEQPTGFNLSQNFPNPFNPSTTIPFQLDTPGQIQLSIFDVTGAEVFTYSRAHLPAGRHDLLWEAMGNTGETLETGIYFCRLSMAGEQETIKMLLLR